MTKKGWPALSRNWNHSTFWTTKVLSAMAVVVARERERRNVELSVADRCPRPASYHVCGDDMQMTVSFASGRKENATLTLQYSWTSPKVATEISCELTGFV